MNKEHFRIEELYFIHLTNSQTNAFCHHYGYTYYDVIDMILQQGSYNYSNVTDPEYYQLKNPFYEDNIYNDYNEDN